MGGSSKLKIKILVESSAKACGFILQEIK